MAIKKWFSYERLIPALTVILSFVAQALDLFGIIQLSTGEQIILLLVGLIAVDALTERIKVLDKIKAEIFLLRDSNIHANRFFTRRNDKIPNLHEFLDNAKTIDVSGLSLLAVTTQNFDLLQKKAESGCSIRLLCLNPENEHLLEQTGGLSGSPSPARLKGEISLGISSILTSGLLETTQVELRLCDYSMAHTMLITDRHTPTSQMRVELYVWEKTGTARPGFFLEKQLDTYWYDLFMEEFEYLWTKSVPVVPK